MKITKTNLRHITLEGIKYYLSETNSNLSYLENNGLELCADWLESEIMDQNLNLSFKEEQECVDYMVKVFYEKVDELIIKSKTN